MKMFVRLLIVSRVGKLASVLLFAALTTCAASDAPRLLLLDRAASLNQWVLSLGREVPGAEGKLNLLADGPAAPCLRLEYDFSGGGRYVVAMRRRMAVPEAETVVFEVFSDGGRRGMARVVDATGQTHLASFTIEPGIWQRVRLPLNRETFGASWGGAKDDVIHFPIRRVDIGTWEGKPLRGDLLLRNLAAEVTAPNPGDTVRLRIVPQVPSGVALTGEKAATRLQVENLLRTPRRVRLRATLRNDKNETREQAWHLEIGPWENGSRQLTVPSDGPAYWRIEGILTENGADRGRLESALLVVERPPNYGKADPDSFFGIMFVKDFEAADRLASKVDRPQAYWGYMTKGPRKYVWDRLDSSIARARENGVGVILTVRPEKRPGWAEWKSLRQLVREPHLEDYRDFVRQIVSRYKGKLMALEISNEPNLTFSAHPNYSIEEGASIAATLHNEAWKVVREIDPSLPVMGADISGGDFRRGFPFLTAMLQRIDSGRLYAFGGHPYTAARYFGPTRRAAFPEDYQLRKLALAALDTLEAHNQPRRFWSSELGWAYDVPESALSDSALGHAAVTARALTTMKSVPGVEKVVWFAWHLWGGSAAKYGIFRGADAYPAPAAGAFATCARLLHHSAPAGQVDLGPGLRAWRFDSNEHDTATIVLWALEGAMRYDVGGAPKSMRAVGMLGRTVGNGPGIEVPLSYQPLYMQASLTDADALVAALQQAERRPPKPVTIKQGFLASLSTVRCVLFNHMRDAVEASVVLPVLETRRTFRLQPGRNEVDLAVELKPGGGEAVRQEVVVTARGQADRTFVNTDVVPMRRLPATVTPRADTRLAETRALHTIVLDSMDYVRPPDAMVGWNGTEDLSVKSWFGWTPDALYFAARVRDDTHCVDDPGIANFWKYDSIQIAIDPRGDSGFGFDENDRELDLVLGYEKPHAYLLHPTRRELAGVCAARRDGTDTVYEAVISWEALDIPAPGPGEVMAINFIVNENDGRGRDYWMGLTAGIGSGRAPNIYKRFAILPVAE